MYIIDTKLQSIEWENLIHILGILSQQKYILKAHLDIFFNNYKYFFPKSSLFNNRFPQLLIEK